MNILQEWTRNKSQDHQGSRSANVWSLHRLWWRWFCQSHWPSLSHSLQSCDNWWQQCTGKFRNAEITLHYVQVSTNITLRVYRHWSCHAVHCRLLRKFSSLTFSDQNTTVQDIPVFMNLTGANHWTQKPHGNGKTPLIPVCMHLESTLG